MMKKNRTRPDSKRKRFRLAIERLESRRLLAGPYSPPAGVEGSTAVHHLDSRIVGWATSVVDYSPGSEVDESFQDITQALGPADSNVTATVTLGRGGVITVGFEFPVRDGLGFDFAVFENGVTPTFLELAKVAVSSDGSNFFEFESDSLTANPVSAFGALDATEIDGLAGKYEVGYGTPFDLGSLRDVNPLLDVDRVTHIRLTDVVGDGFTLDSGGDPIYDPYPTVQSAGFDLDGIGVMHFRDAGQDLSDFEDVGEALLPNTAFSGPIEGGQQSEGEFEELITSGWFTSGGLEFNNTHAEFTNFTTWNQWAYSNITDNTTPGHQNQFGVSSGIGGEESATFGVAFVSQSESPVLPTIRKPAGDNRRFDSLLVTNTTYAALSMQQGDSFAKKFGGETGNDEDFFRLTITGKDSSGSEVGSLEVYLADYRFADNQQDYILTDWLNVDLDSLSDADSLEFFLHSSDVGSNGMNTPAYFAVDQIKLTEPAVFLDFDPSIVSEDINPASTGGRVTRINTDDVAALTVTIDHDETSRLGFPSSVTIPSGDQYFDFSIDVIDDEVVQGDQVISTTVSASGFIPDTADLTVVDDDVLSLHLDSEVTALAEGNTASVTVSRNDAQLALPLTINLTTDEDSIIGIPSQLLIPAGQASAVFTVQAIEDSLDRADQLVQIHAAATSYQPASFALSWEDNDQPALTLTTAKSSYSESDGLSTVGFELIGRTVPSESFLNGSDQSGGFESKDLFFNNSYDPEWGSWSGWSISNTTDSTTAGFLNQYSAYPAKGANESDTYAVASAFDFTPTIQRDEGATSGFHSLAVSNTTYAALSMQQGDAFAKKFGGPSGDDPDWFLLTIEGFDNQQQTVGTVDFYLADYRFADNQFDYVIDSWVNISLESISSAVDLRFSLSSSDMGEFGMNTPASFAIDQVAMVSSDPIPQMMIERNTYDVTSELEVVVSSNDETELTSPGFIRIPAGASSISVPLPILRDELVDGDRSVTLTANAEGFPQTELALMVTDSDVAELTLSIAPQILSENAGQASLLVHRNLEEPSSELSVVLTGDPQGELQHLDSVVIAEASRTSITNIEAINNDLADGDRSVILQGAAEGYVSGSFELTVVDDEKSLELTTEVNRPGEQDARSVSSFEDLGSTIPSESYLNGKRYAGSFDSGDLSFNNSYNPAWGNWSGWAISNTTDTETAGYLNQFSSITGGGAFSSDTFAVANAYPGGLVPEIVITDEQSEASFQSVMISNTTYAALSMQQGDAFAKKFGGDSGTDPDYFLLKIKGLASSGDEVGEIEFALADFRFEDSADDYLVNDWVHVDLSTLVGAKKLQFSLESSDMGEYGMNTPAYFALDHLVLSDPSYAPPKATITRVNSDLSEPLLVSLSSSDLTELAVSQEITIPAGVSSVEVAFHAVDDNLFDGDQSATLTVSSEGYIGDSEDLIVEDDDDRQLTFSLWSEGSSYSEGAEVELVVHRNDSDLSSALVLQLTDQDEEFVLPSSGLQIPSGQSSVLFSLPVRQNTVVDGDRVARLSVGAEGYTSQTLELTILDVVAPVAVADNYTVSIGSSVQINDTALGLLANDYDADGDSIEINISTLVYPTKGILTINPNGIFAYTNSEGKIGDTDEFEYQVTDSTGMQSGFATVTITLTVSSYQNPTLQADVNADGRVSAIDALLVINFLNRNLTGGETSVRVSTIGTAPPDYLDVNGDGGVSASDALFVINRLASANTPGGEMIGVAAAQANAATSGLNGIPHQNVGLLEESTEDLVDQIFSGPTEIHSTREGSDWYFGSVLKQANTTTTSASDQALSSLLEDGDLESAV